MDKKTAKLPGGSLVVVDELAVVKSAAWAWYQHGSGSGSASIPEFDAWRTKIEPKPSRFKLEALRDHHLQQASKSPNTTILLSSPKSTSNSLLDNYEIERISRQLDYYIESSHAKYHRGDSGGPAAVAEMKSKVVHKKKVVKGPINWLRHAPACGSSRDIDVAEDYKSFECSSRPGKGRVAVAGVVSRRPRPRCIRA